MLGVSQQLLPSFKNLNDESEALLLLYELCLNYCDHKDHNIVNASLETLQQLLKSAPPLIVYLLSVAGAVGKSRLTVDQFEGEPENVQATDLLPHVLPTDSSLQSISDITEVMNNSILSFYESNVQDSEGNVADSEENDADSAGDESREDIILPPPDPKPNIESL